MNVAWISGRAGRAVVETDKATYFLIVAEDAPSVFECSPRHLEAQLRTYDDVVPEAAGPFPFSLAQRSLALAALTDRARLYVFGLIDVGLEDDLRRDLVKELDVLISDDLVHARLLGSLESAPFPRHTDIYGGLQYAAEGDARRVIALFTQWTADAPFIDRAHEAWNTNALEEFLTETDRATARAWFGNTGGFHRLVEALQSNSATSFQQWMVRVIRSAPAVFGPAPARSLKKLLEIAGVGLAAQSSTPAQDEREHFEEQREGGRRGRQRRLRGQEVLTRVNAQIDALLRRIEMGDETTAERYRHQLLLFQQDNSTPEQIAKSLCTIAARARLLGATSFAERSLREALTIRPDDAWTWSQLSVVLRDEERLEEANEAARLGDVLGTPYGIVQVAEALRAQQRYDAALTAYDEAVERFPDNVFAANGRAEVLKAQGRYDAALAAYDDVVERFPDNQSAVNGRAEVLKAQGHYDAALAAYDEAIKRFPDNLFAANGRAEVLKAQGRHQEALAAYDATRMRFPNDSVTASGRAGLLKAQGLYDLALAAYDDAIRRFPDSPVVANGRAEVRRAQGQYEEALAAYDATRLRFSNDPVAWNGRAEVLKVQGRHDLALAAYNDAIERFPDDVFAANGRADVLKAQGKYQEALSAYDETRLRFPDDPVVLTGRAEVLKVQGRYDLALAAYDEAVARFPNNRFAANGRAEVLKAQGRYEEALAIYDATRLRFPGDAVTRNGRASVLVQMGRYEEAIASLPTEDPSDLQGWVALHILGMIRIKQQKLDEAIKIFQRGARLAPGAPAKSYFRNALAVALIRQRNFERVIDDLRPNVQRMPKQHRTISTVLLAHACAETANLSQAQGWLNETDDAIEPVILDLRRSLAKRYSLELAESSPNKLARLEPTDSLIEEQEFQMLTLPLAA